MIRQVPLLAALPLLLGLAGSRLRNIRIRPLAGANVHTTLVGTVPKQS